MSEINAVTFEVIRNRLVAISDEMRIALQAVSGSPTVTEASDFFTGLFLPNGSVVSMGFQVSFQAPVCGQVIRHINGKPQLKVKDGDIYQPWFINMVQEIHRKLDALPASRPANFLSMAAQKVKYMGADENGLVFKRLIPTEGVSTDDPEKAAQQLSFLREGLEENPVMAPMLLFREDADGNRSWYPRRAEGSN